MDNGGFVLTGAKAGVVVPWAGAINATTWQFESYRVSGSGTWGMIVNVICVTAS